MLFGSLFKGDKGITVGRRRKRKLTARDVIQHLNNFDLTTATCTLIRDQMGNEKIESYGQVDVFRLRDEEVFALDGTFCITTPTGMKLKSDVGSDLAGIISQVEHVPEATTDDPFKDDEDAASSEEGEGGEDDEEEGEDDDLMPIAASKAEPEPKPKENAKPKNTVPKQAVTDAFSESPNDRMHPPDAGEQVLGLGQVIRLRFFFRRVPYELDCQIVDRFNPSRLSGEVDLTPRFGVGYQVRPLTDVRNRDQRRYIRYTHRMGFGHLRVRNEIQFHVFAHRTTLEIPERGALKPVLTYDDFKTIPFGSPVVEELKSAEKLEDVVEFFMRCMVNNPSEKRYVYISKPYFDVNRRKSSLEGLGHYTTVGAQQTTILPKIFLKKPLKGKTVLERMLAEKGKGPRDTHKMRIIEELQDRYSLLTREQKIWQARRRQKSRAENHENDTCHVGFFASWGTAPGDVYNMRALTMACELIDMGLENLTFKPIPFDDARARETEEREFVRQENGFPVDLLNFSVGGTQLRGSEDADHHEQFLKYIVGDNYDALKFEDKIEALRQYAILLYFYPVLTFARSQIQDFEPYLPFRIPVMARVARFRTALDADSQEPQIVSLGLEFIYNPIQDSFSRDLNLYDQWEQITPYTENHYFIEIHKSLQLLFGFDRALDENLRGDLHKSKDGGSEHPEDDDTSSDGT